MKKNILLVFTAILLSHVAAAQTWQFANSYGESDLESASDVVTDIYGKVYAAGVFNSAQLQLGLTTHINRGEHDIIVIKHDTAGALLWSVSAGGAQSEGVDGIDCDLSGNIFIAGHFSSDTLIMGSDTLLNTTPGLDQPDPFIAKLGPGGNVLWAKSAQGDAIDVATDIACDSAGNAIVTGYFVSTSITFDSITLPQPAFNGFFLVKLDPAGNIIYAKTNSAGSCAGWHIALDVRGNQYVAGDFTDTLITFDGISVGTQSPFGNTPDVFIVKYDVGGNAVWLKDVGGRDFDQVNGIASDPWGNIGITGVYFSDSIHFDNFTLYNQGAAGAGDYYLARYNTNGDATWARSFTYGWGEGWAVTADPFGNYYSAGNIYSDTVVFGADTLYLTDSISYSDVFVVRYDSLGNEVWANSAHGLGYEDIRGICPESTGNIYVVGDFGSPVMNFGALSVSNTPGGSYDMFLAKIGNSFPTVIGQDAVTRSFTLFPVPAGQTFNVVLPETMSDAMMTVYSATGQLMMSKHITTGVTSIQNAFPGGLYVVKVTGDRQSFSARLVIGN
jgi:hypothetical protein